MAYQSIVWNESPLFSIIVPAYHSGDTLSDTLESIIGQTCQRWELILCDDGTPDFNVLEMEQQICTQLPDGCRATVLHQPQNVGTVKNLNIGLRAAKGEWVMLLAADDVLAGTDVLESLSNIAHETANQWIVSRTELRDEQLGRIGKYSPLDIENLKNSSGNELYSRLCYGCLLPAGGSLFRRELLESIGGFDETYRLVEDWPLFLKLVRSGIVPEFCAEISVLHRDGGVSWANAAQNQVYQKDLIETMHREILPYLDRVPEKDRNLLQRRCEDKMAVYKYRFEEKGVGARLKWLFQHGDVVIRKMME